MEKEYFQKLAANLADKYGKDELAKLLVKNKDRRISNLLASAYNKSVNSKVSLEKLDDEVEYYEDFVNRTIGPESWFYNYISTAEWDKFRQESSALETETGRDSYIFTAYTNHKNRVKEQNKKDMLGYEWADRREIKRIAEEYKMRYKNSLEGDGFPTAKSEEVLYSYNGIMKKYLKYYKVPNIF